MVIRLLSKVVYSARKTQNHKGQGILPSESLKLSPEICFTSPLEKAIQDSRTWNLIRNQGFLSWFVCSFACLLVSFFLLYCFVSEKFCFFS